MGTIALFKHHVRTETLLLGLADFLVIAGSVLGGVRIRFAGSGKPFLERLPEVAIGTLVVALVLVVTMVATGLYQRWIGKHLSGFILRLGIAFGLGLMVLSVIFYLIPPVHLGRGIMVLGLLLAFVGVVGVRLACWALVGRSGLQQRVLVLGTGKGAQALEQYRQEGDWWGKELVGYLHIEPTSPRTGLSPILESGLPLPSLVQLREIDELVVAVDERRNVLPVQDLMECRVQGVEVVDLLTFLERETGKVKLDLVAPSWFTYTPGFFYRGMIRKALKRSVDLLAAGALLGVTSPLMIAAALAIWLESGFRGSIFYRQTRVGENAEHFQILKFRSMREDAEQFEQVQWAEANDPRITKVGRTLRKYRIDELPQIVNILRGEMSFVGPRPERPEIEETFLSNLPYYTERYRVKPGLTGWAQIRYPYGASREDSFEKLQYDLYYVKNYSLFLDLLILLETVEVVLWGKGAR